MRLKLIIETCVYALLTVLLMHCVGEHNSVTTKYDSGEVKESYRLVKGKAEGIYRSFYRSGVLEIEAEVHNGVQNGKLKQYYPTGNIKKVTQFKNGVEVDTAYFYNNDGSIRELSYFSRRSGSRMFTVEFEKGIMHSYLVSPQANRINYGLCRRALCYGKKPTNTDLAPETINSCGKVIPLSKHWVKETDDGPGTLFADYSDDERDNIVIQRLSKDIEIYAFLDSIYQRSNGVELVYPEILGVEDLVVAAEIHYPASDNIIQRVVVKKCEEHYDLIVLAASRETYLSKLAVLYYILVN